MVAEPSLLLGDCFEMLGTLEAESIDACVTDPPYGLGFMGKHWDKGVPDADVWRRVYRVLKPGAHLLSFFGTRTYHRGACAIEDAWFEIRDQIGWLYGSGFPKSLNIAKQDGCESWDGWGTALKPAWEPIVLARKPLDGTVANNVLTHGVGGLNIDGCRVEYMGDADKNSATPQGRCTAKRGALAGKTQNQRDRQEFERPTQNGRFPANIIHDGSDEVLAEFAKYGESKSTDRPRYNTVSIGSTGAVYSGSGGTAFTGSGHADQGTAARFFYTAKASKDDRNDGLWDWEHAEAHDMTDRKPGTAGLESPRAGAGRTSGARNHHPTVKPISLMRYLVRLVTPKGGSVLDPFAGSGTTLIAAYREDCYGIGIEKDPEYFQMARHRVEKATAQMRLAL